MNMEINKKSLLHFERSVLSDVFCNKEKLKIINTIIII